MKAITSVPAASLVWREPETGGSRHELWSGEDLLAAMEVEPSGRAATVETAEGSFAFRLADAFHPSALVRDEASGTDIAEYHAGFLGRGLLRFDHGPVFHWRHEGFGSAEWSFRGEGGEVLIALRLEPAAEPRTFQAEVDVTPAGRFSSRVPLLASLGWYLILMRRPELRGAGSAVESVF